MENIVTHYESSNMCAWTILIVSLLFSFSSSQIQNSPQRVPTPYCRFLILRTEDQNRVGICCVDVATDFRDLIFTISEDNQEETTFDDDLNTTTDSEVSTTSTPEDNNHEKRDAAFRNMKIQRRCKKRVPLKKNQELVGRCCIFDEVDFGDDLESVDLPESEADKEETTTEGKKKGPFKWRTSGMRVNSKTSSASSFNILNSECNKGFVMDDEGDCVPEF